MIFENLIKKILVKSFITVILNYRDVITLKKITKKVKTKGKTKTMKKTELLNLLNEQAKQPNTKTTRQHIIKVVTNLVKKHIKDNADIQGISTTRNAKGVNLGDVVEIITKSIYKNELVKDSKDYDLTDNGEKVEVKFTTSDAYAHKINPEQKVAYYLIIAYTQSEGGIVFKVPFAERDKIKVNNQGRVITNQLARFQDNNLTNRVFH